MLRVYSAMLTCILLFSSHLVAAERQTLDVAKTDTLTTMLQKQEDKNVTLKMASGNEISGKVKSVGDNVIYLTRIRGIEYYDAVISLDKIEGIVVRVMQ